MEEIRYQASMDRSRFMDGHMEGEKKGVEKNRMATARIMKQEGEPVEKIVKYTQLTRKEAEDL
uniref:Uncharacterized protein n=1 Tax=Candidatus Kentrum sp. FM TaxID=2126340 RepID=A0A450TSF2_9GAMM|nr:MAG: hypothetical protein BECKFM1743C_GA0114222_105952 [Candidatus Kentron sp. FM]